MRALRIAHAGMFTTVQDLGRPGHTSIGVPPSGAASSAALMLGNRLLGNADDHAALECTLTGPGLVVDDATWICLTGAACPQARLVRGDTERLLPPFEPVQVERGDSVLIGPIHGGSRAYLCVSGGLAVPRVLGSRSTHAGSGLGGHEGRALRAGDVIPMGPSRAGPRPPPDGLDAWWGELTDRSRLRIMPSLDTAIFPAESVDLIASASFLVSEHSSRMGVRLNGPAVPSPEGAARHESEPTVTGGIQIAGDGQPIVLGCDRPTTGGYPVIACVIGADLDVIAKLRPRDTVSFDWVTREQARHLARTQRDSLDALLPAIAPSAPS